MRARDLRFLRCLRFPLLLADPARYRRPETPAHSLLWFGCGRSAALGSFAVLKPFQATASVLSARRPGLSPVMMARTSSGEGAPKSSGCGRGAAARVGAGRRRDKNAYQAGPRG